MGIIFRMGNSTTRTPGLLLVRQLCSMSQSAPSRNRPETRQPVQAENATSPVNCATKKNQFKTTVAAVAVLGTYSHDKTHFIISNCSYTEVYLSAVFVFRMQLWPTVFKILFFQIKIVSVALHMINIIGNKYWFACSFPPHSGCHPPITCPSNSQVVRELFNSCGTAR